MKPISRSLPLLVAVTAALAACTVNVPAPAVPPAAPATVPSASASAPAAPSSAAPSASPLASPAASPAVTPPPTKGAPTVPSEFLADDELEDAEDWEDTEWEDEVSDLDWEAGGLSGYGADVDDVDYWGGTDEDGDGDTDYHALASVEVEGAGTHRISFDEDDQPLMSEEPDVVIITDLDADEEIVFAADQEFNAFTVVRDQDDVTIEILGDGTFVVNGQEAEDTDAAAEAILATDTGAETSLHSLAFMLGVLERHDLDDDSRGNPSCQNSGSASRNNQKYRTLGADAPFGLRQGDEDEGEDLEDEEDVETDDEETDDEETGDEETGDEDEGDAEAEGEDEGEDGDEAEMPPALEANSQAAFDLLSAVIARRQGN